MNHATSFAPRPSLLALVIAGIGLAVAPAAHAGVTHSLSAQVQASGTVDSDANATSVQANADGFTPGGSSNALAFGSSTGSYFTSASGQGAFTSSNANFHHVWTLTNTNSVPVAYDLGVRINAGSLSVSGGTPGTASASYALTISRDSGPNLFVSAVGIDGVNVSPIGTLLDGAGGTASAYSWSTTNTSLSLGILNPGQSTSIAYDLATSATGTSPCEVVFSEPTFQAAATIGYGGCASAFAQLGDPNRLGGSPIFVVNETPIIPSGVPVPASLALLGLGLAGLPFARRRRTR